MKVVQSLDEYLAERWMDHLAACHGPVRTVLGVHDERYLLDQKIGLLPRDVGTKDLLGPVLYDDLDEPIVVAHGGTLGHM